MSMNPDGSQEMILLNNEYITNDVEVSPDNTKLAFSLQDSVSAGYTFYTMDIDGSNIEDLFSEPDLILWPSWGSIPDVTGADLIVSAISVEKEEIIFEDTPWTWIDYTVTNTGDIAIAGPIESDVFNLIYKF